MKGRIFFRDHFPPHDIINALIPRNGSHGQVIWDLFHGRNELDSAAGSVIELRAARLVSHQIPQTDHGYLPPVIGGCLTEKLLLNGTRQLFWPKHTGQSNSFTNS